ncbi:hypothetical protein BGX23_003515, partial [Mortierella sp. AD031]
APAPGDELQYTFYPDKTLYIRGGANQDTAVTQFFSLDLTPLLSHSGKLTWKRLVPASGSAYFRSKMPMAVNRLNQAVTNFLEDGTVQDYNTLTDKWDFLSPQCSGSNSVNRNISVKSGLGSAMDPKSGLNYIPYGYGAYRRMLVYDPDGNVCSGLPMPSTSSGDYRVAWSDSKQTIYLFGTTATPTPGPSLWEFQFATKNWKQIVESLDGQKLIVFGGEESGVPRGEIYIFDTVTYRWTAGARPPDNRTDMACATAGDYFLFWGGIDRLSGSPADIVFYNVRADKWVKQTDIAPPASTSIGTVPSSTSSTTGSGGGIGTGTPDTTLAPKSNVAAIGGGIAGAVVVTVAIVVFLFVRRRYRTQAGTKRKGSPDVVATTFPGGTSDAPLSSTHSSPLTTSNLYSGSSIEKTHAVGNPHMPITPPANYGGGYAETQGYGQSATYPSTPPPIPARPQLYNRSLQHQEQQRNGSSNNNPQYISPSALALGEVFPQPPPTVRNPQGVQNSNTNNDDNLDNVSDPLQKLALIQAELESVRKQIETQNLTRQS